MRFHEYNGQMYTVKQLSEISGVSEASIRDRLRRGYSVDQVVRHTPTNDSVEHFCESSWYEDWIGMSTSYLHKIYWKWCVSNGYTPIQIQGFTRQIMKKYPNLKVVPTKVEDKSLRIIRER